MPTDTCAGKLTRVSARPHPLCRGGNGHEPCTRWQYGITGGIEPRWIDQDGTATCADRLGHGQGKVGDESPACAPTR